MNLERGVFVAAILGLGTLSLLLVLPLLQYVLLAVLLGYVLHPVHERLAPRIGSRLSAGGLVAGTALVVLLPIGAVIAVAANQAVQVLTALRTGRLGIDTIERFLREQVGVTIDIGGAIGSTLTPDAVLGVVEGQSGAALFGRAASLFGGLSNVVIGLTVLVFLSYYLLTDGVGFVRWLRDVAPVPGDDWDELVARVDRLLWAVIVGNVAVATVQGVLTGIGFVVVGFPNTVFWTVVTVVLGLLPLIGASIVWLPASIYLFVLGRPLAAVVLFVYGATLVSIADNYLRPMIGGREAGLNPGLFVLGISGGLFVFGFLGVFFGPVVLGTLKVLVELFARDGTTPDASESSDRRRPRLGRPMLDRMSVGSATGVDTPTTIDDDQRAS
ncbi:MULTISPECIES: AI-2E family transporter [Halococcus]|uniref:Permease n=1 Tax=Halococcus salifodinae DSM 8989 TaxID=1227456 RepID=M0N424_9EURY|nr:MULTISPECIES: AI-2E family transporter [Halococcus]EMA52611.1 hypothetical protein C450_10948 [Halococcus salifodinae DSM 8989]